MINILKSFFIFLLTFFIININAKNYEKEARNILKKEVSEDRTIICSPDGRDGSLKPAQAMGKLKTRGKLILLPGKYPGELEISKDKITIEGVPGKKSDLSIKILGKDCIIKNIWMNRLSLSRDATVVNSLLSDIYCSYSNRNNNTKIKILNSMLSHIYCSGYEKLNVIIANSTIYHSSSSYCIYASYDSDIEIYNSILNSKTKIFNFYTYSRKECKLKLENNLMFAEMSLGSTNTYSSSKKSLIVYELKNLKKICRLRCDSKTKFEPIEFKTPITSYYLKPENSLLLDESLEYGVKFSPEWFEETDDKKEETDNKKQDSIKLAN